MRAGVGFSVCGGNETYSTYIPPVCERQEANTAKEVAQKDILLHPHETGCRRSTQPASVTQQQVGSNESENVPVGNHTKWSSSTTDAPITPPLGSVSGASRYPGSHHTGISGINTHQEGAARDSEARLLALLQLV